MSTEDRIYWTVVAFLAVVGAAVAAVLLWPRPQPVIEVAKPAIVQSDESLILERTDKPTAVIADGIKDAPGVSRDAHPANNPRAGDLSLVRLKDDTKRVIASSPDGEIVGGMDIPVETLTYKSRVWAAGISVDPVHQVGGVWVERDIGRIRVGAEVGANRYHDFETRLRVGVTW